MADLASQAAAEAAARSKKIQQETQKLSVQLKKSSEDETKTEGQGGVIQDPKADVNDIRKRSVHHINLQDRLPWLREIESKQTDSVDSPQLQRVISPDSGVMDTLSEGTDPPSENLSPLHITLTPTSSEIPTQASKDTIPVHLQNGGPLSEGEEFELPPKDYPILLPPKDYPVLESTSHTTIPSKTTQNDLFGGDDDYYSMMANGVTN